MSDVLFLNVQVDTLSVRPGTSPVNSAIATSPAPMPATMRAYGGMSGDTIASACCALFVLFAAGPAACTHHAGACLQAQTPGNSKHSASTQSAACQHRGVASCRTCSAPFLSLPLKFGSQEGFSRPSSFKNLKACAQWHDTQPMLARQHPASCLHALCKLLGCSSLFGVAVP